MSRYYRRVERAMMEKTTLRREATEGNDAREGQPAVVWAYPELEGQVTFLHTGRTTIGRDFSSDIRLPGDGTSRHHAEIVREAALFTIEDRESTNGVYVNARRIRRAPLEEGDVVRVGDWIGVVRRLAQGHAEGAAFREIAPGYFGGPRTRDAMEPLRKAAGSDLPVIIEGPTGTGKEGVARAAHLWSGRKGPFIAVNCAALPDTLAEAELFGYRKGAFTNADRASAGHFRAANGGTLFLDELTDMPAAVQPTLLRVLEQREVTPLGESTPIPLDVRVVVATQTPLSQAVHDKRLRPDLVARLDGVQVSLLPLGDRIEEIPFLFANLLRVEAREREAPAFDPGLIESLCCHTWPLNIRELTKVVKKLLALHGSEAVLKRNHLQGLMSALKDGVGGTPSARRVPEGDDLSIYDEMPRDDEGRPLDLTRRELEERRLIVRTLGDHAGNQSAAAKALNMSRGAFVERLKKYGIPRPHA